MKKLKKRERFTTTDNIKSRLTNDHTDKVGRSDGISTYIYNIRERDYFERDLIVIFQIKFLANLKSLSFKKNSHHSAKAKKISQEY